MPSSSTKPKKVVLHADENFIKHLYAEHDQDYNNKQQQRSYHRPTTYSFTPPSNSTISTANSNNTSNQTNNNSTISNNSTTSSSSTSTSIRHKKTAELISRRITKFYTLFDPMINFLLMNRYALYNKQCKKIDNVESMPVDYVMVVHLMDCSATKSINNDGGGASKSGRAQQQLLRIDKLEPRPISELNEKERLSLQRDLSSNKQSNEEEFLLPHLVSYTVPTTTTNTNNTTINNNKANKNDAAAGYVWTSIRTNCYDFNPLIIGRVSQKALMGRCIAFAQGINDIARGERPDLYEMIKRQMKEVRRSKKMLDVEDDEMPLRGVGGANRSATSCSHSWNDEDKSENKENVDPNAKTTIRKSGNEKSIGLKELNRSTKTRLHKDENRNRARKSVL